MRLSLESLLLLAAAASPLSAQGRWKEIGKTSVGNSVYVDPRSVKTVSGIITAQIRVKFVDPVKTPDGLWAASHHTAMFDCAHKTVAGKESWYYSDEAANKVVKHTTIAQPGFGPAIGGSMTQVALDYMCRKP
ncbi:MAG: surface-adhesin E family protein [bacterium]